MGDSRVAALAVAISPPTAGQISVVATSTSTQWFDMRTKVASDYTFSGRFVDVTAETEDCYVALVTTGATAIDGAAVNSGGAPPADGCVLIPAGQTRTWFQPNETSTLRYLAFRAVGVGKIRISPSSARELPR